MLDVDRFKDVNDTLGHSAGDALLRKLAARLTGCVREEDLVARPGGDEFTVVCTRAANDHAIAEVATRLVDAAVKPFQIDGGEVFMTASVGVAVSEHGSESPEELLRDADAAMYRAKNLGGGRFELFDPQLRQHLPVHQPDGHQRQRSIRSLLEQVPSEAAEPTRVDRQRLVHAELGAEERNRPRRHHRPYRPTSHPVPDSVPQRSDTSKQTRVTRRPRERLTDTPATVEPGCGHSSQRPSSIERNTSSPSSDQHQR